MRGVGFVKDFAYEAVAVGAGGVVSSVGVDVTVAGVMLKAAVLVS
jgi:hypothetical protein